MRISVIVPTYRRPQKLAQCLESLAAQKLLPSEVVITYQTQDAETRTVLSEWENHQLLKLTLLEVHEPGVIYAENTAIAYVLREKQTELVTFMDDDAIAFPDWLEKIQKFFQNHPLAAALGGPDIILSEPESYHDHPVTTVGKIRWPGKVIGNHHRKSKGLREVDVLKGVNMTVALPYLQLLDQKLQGRDPAKGNGVFWELDLCLSIKHKGGQIYFDPDLIIKHDSNHAHFIKEAVVESTGHNLGYVMLKHLHPLQAMAFIIYGVILGNGHVRGFLKMLSTILEEGPKQSFTYSRASLRGFLSGIRLALFHR